MSAFSRRQDGVTRRDSSSSPSSGLVLLSHDDIAIMQFLLAETIDDTDRVTDLKTAEGTTAT